MRVLWNHLSESCRITYTRSLYHAPFGPLVSGSCRTTCTKSLYQDPFGPLVSGSCRRTCARSLYQDPVGPFASGSCKRANSARLPEDLDFQKECLIETSSDTEDPDFQNERFMRDFPENWSGAQTSVLCETSSKTEDPTSKTIERVVRHRETLLSVNQPRKPEWQANRALNAFQEVHWIIRAHKSRSAYWFEPECSPWTRVCFWYVFEALTQGASGENQTPHEAFPLRAEHPSRE